MQDHYIQTHELITPISLFLVSESKSYIITSEDQKMALMNRYF